MRFAGPGWRSWPVWSWACCRPRVSTGSSALTGLVVLFASMWLAAEARDRRSVALSGAACGIGLIPGVVLGFTDVSLRSHRYLHDLRSDVKLLVVAMVASIVVAIVLVVVVPPLARRISRMPGAVPVIAGGLVAGCRFRSVVRAAARSNTCTAR